MKSYRDKMIGAGALAALLCILLAQSGTAQGPKSKDRELTFQANSIPWKELFNWLSDRTGMPVLTSGAKIPAGSLNIISAKRTQYTLPQVMDIINQNLLEQKCRLLPH